jgi:hypothetical protein
MSITMRKGSSRWKPSDQRCVYGLRMSLLKTEVCVSVGEGGRGVEGIAPGKKLAEPRAAVGATVEVAVLFGESDCSACPASAGNGESVDPLR